MVEQLPFKQLVWSSSLQRPTKKTASFKTCGFFILRERTFAGTTFKKTNRVPANAVFHDILAENNLLEKSLATEIFAFPWKAFLDKIKV